MKTLNQIAKTSTDDIGIYLMMFVSAFVPAFCFFYTAGSLVGDYFYHKVQPSFYSVRTILGFTPSIHYYASENNGHY